MTQRDDGPIDPHTIACTAIELSTWAIPDLNALTVALAERGIAVSFSQYIPEFHDEAPTSEVVNRPQWPQVSSDDPQRSGDGPRY